MDPIKTKQSKRIRNKLNLVDLFALNDIAEISGISLNTLRSAVRTRQLKARKIGREYKSTQKEILKYLELDEKDV